MQTKRRTYLSRQNDLHGVPPCSHKLVPSPAGKGDREAVDEESGINLHFGCMPSSSSVTRFTLWAALLFIYISRATFPAGEGTQTRSRIARIWEIAVRRRTPNELPRFARRELRAKPA